MPEIPIRMLLEALEFSWSRTTSSRPEEWNRQNPARGQCVPSALIVQDFYGGDLERLDADTGTTIESHYRNILTHGLRFDTTEQQYDDGVQLTLRGVVLGGYHSIREKRLANRETEVRYMTLRESVILYLQGAQILHDFPVILSRQLL